MTTQQESPTERAIARQRKSGETQQAGWLAKGLMSRLPEHLRDELIGLAAERADAARQAKAAGLPSPVSTPTGEVPASEQTLRQQAAARERSLQACLPDDRVAADVGLASLDPDQHPDGIAAWLADPDARTAIFAGRTGSGKTQAAYAAAAEAARRGAATRLRSGEVVTKPLLVRAWTMQGYLAQLRPDGSKHKVWEIRDRAYTAELLIIDDLAAEMDIEAKEFVRRELLELIEYRLNARLRTIFTTNLRARDVEQRDGTRVAGLETMLGDRLFSRLQDRATAFTFLGPDRRSLAGLDW
ncbi:hypothetical protein ABZ671_18485 [Micromonospora sp. NPDC006766]|uniref:hypothetical protein n=1 Tax=Micromonospora sp. NPDC006766 TaxID=3154778 RepID=UPI0033D1E3E0